MFTARTIPGLAPVQGPEGLATLGTLAALPAGVAASFGRVARRYPSAALRPAAAAGTSAAAGTALGRQGLPAAAVQLLARALAALAAGADRLGRHLARQREMRLTEHALRQLDTRTLRDIGLTRSEIGSAAAEAAGSVEATRARAWLEIGTRVY